MIKGVTYYVIRLNGTVTNWLGLYYTRLRKNAFHVATISEWTYPRLCKHFMILLSFANFIIFSLRSPVHLGSFKWLAKCFKAPDENLLAYSFPQQKPPNSHTHLSQKIIANKIIVLLLIALSNLLQLLCLYFEVIFQRAFCVWPQLDQWVCYTDIPVLVSFQRFYQQISKIVKKKHYYLLSQPSLHVKVK